MLLSNAVGNLNHEFESCAPLNWDLDMQFDVIRDFKVCKKKKKKNTYDNGICINPQEISWNVIASKAK